ncbi:M-phase-specific PLK1-interacting protein [Takifugu flavidus]|uniref:M-phase-specific PLK1-interacting protein n=1 Tax=Takifugu flavidus TaxID=433684 RepID=A0A5C6P009_9TELE|nr:M-phase-specific PLK1-interacting protein [Takifugu flavidus]TWW73122.1 hypothetical protein D4764_15G0005160 [Takifugu flavidus]
MDRGSVRPPWSPGALRPPARFPSPGSGWGFSGHRGAFSPRSPGYPPGPHRGYRGFSPAGFGSASRGHGGRVWRRGDRFQPGSPVPVHKHQASDCPVEKYFSASMLQDPWAGLQPVAVTDRHTPP